MSKLARARAETAGTSPFFEKCYRYEEAARVRQTGYYSFFRVIESAQDPEVTIGGRRLVMLGSNNYLGLTNDPRVKEAAIDAIRKYGSGCAGSRFLNGTLDLHVRLEERLAEFMRQEAAVTFSTGFQVNLGAISCLVGKGDTVYLDKQDHACIIDGARLSFGNVKRFKHNDPTDLRRQMRADSEARGRLVVVDGVFSMEGDLAPLPEIVSVAREYAAAVMVDDAHGIGVLGGGRGTAFHFDSADGVDLVMGTFSKALASQGGFIAGRADVIQWIEHFARSFMFSASLSPANVATVSAALDVIDAEPERVQRVNDIAATMRAELRMMDYNIGESQSPIVPIIIGDGFRALQAWKTLFKKGIYTNVALPPAVSPKRALLRTSYMATHTEEQMQRVLDGFREEREKLTKRYAMALD